MVAGLFARTATAQALSHDPFFRYADTSRKGCQPGITYYVIAWNDKQPAGIDIIRQLDEKTAIAALTNVKSYSAISDLATIAPANNDWKFSPALASVLIAPDKRERTLILTGRELNTLISSVSRFNEVKLVWIDSASRSIVVRVRVKLFKEKILSIPELVFADIQPVPHVETAIIGYNRGFHGISALDFLVTGANGKNIVTGVKEQKMEAADLDLHKRIVTSPLAAPVVSNHATVVSSIIGGSGNSFYDGRGIANGCTFFSSNFENLFPDDIAILNTNKVTVQNHSYGTQVQQFYGAEAVSYDAQTWQQQQLLHVFSAGNRGTAAATDGRYAGITGYANLTGNFKMAKNVLTVAAIDNKDVVAAESSAGPAYDGRLVPLLTALGPNGTSDAAAMVSGTAAVLQQVYADSNSQVLPPASLVKALMYTTADDIYTKGIDYKTGFGLLNSYAAVKTLQQKQYETDSVSTAQVWTKNINVPVNAARLKVTLCWTDTAAAVNNLKALVNDLDLEVTGPGAGIVYKPWVLSVFAHADSLAKDPVRNRDSLNTSEQVSIDLPAAGTYELKVTGTQTGSFIVPFSVVYAIDTLNTFSYISPLHTSDVNRAEDDSLTIRWKTFVTDTNVTGNLYLSYNGGVNWQLIQPAFKIYRNKYRWPIKDTASRAMLRMETSFGDFLSREFIISPVCRPQVDFFCTDSFGLSWRKHIYATGYKVYCLTDSPYLKHILTVSDTAVVLNRLLNPSMVYAVEPVPANGIAAARSIAFDISLQGTQCFYRTLYYNLPAPGKADLVLELSSTGYTDSIYFEQLSPSGQVMRVIGKRSIAAGILLYNQFVNDLPSGTSYWRVRIRLKSDVVVYTETISIQSSGNRYLLFYPNPSGRNEPVNYFLQPGLPSDSRLQVFDISGRLLKEYVSLPAQLSFTTLSPGIYICKLISVNNQVLETARLVIR